jgi:hypothetical protein
VVFDALFLAAGLVEADFLVAADIIGDRCWRLLMVTVSGCWGALATAAGEGRRERWWLIDKGRLKEKRGDKQRNGRD